MKRARTVLIGGILAASASLAMFLFLFLFSTDKARDAGALIIMLGCTLAGGLFAVRGYTMLRRIGNADRV